jgi:hypothetical protein
MRRPVGRQLGWSAFVVAVLGAFGITGCDPCFGTASCGAKGPRLVMDGQIVAPGDGSGQDRVTVSVVRTGGVELAHDTATAVTDDGGFWRVEIPALASGEAVVDANVRTAADTIGYWVRGIRLHTVERAGEAQLIDRWVGNPYYAIQAELFLRSTANKRRLGSYQVEFRRTGGVQLTDSVYRATSDQFGRVFLFGPGDLPTTFGEVVGDLTVFLEEPWGASVARGVKIGPPTHVFRKPPSVILVGVGPSLGYYGYIYNRATAKLMPGVRVDVQRTGGIPVQPENLSVVSSPAGLVIFTLEPLARGTVNVRITVNTPPPGTPVVMNASLATFDADTGRHLTNWNIGPHLPYFGVVRANFGFPFVNIPVDIRRTGGIPVQPESFTTRTNGDGVFVVQPVPLALGEAIFEITVHLPPPYTGFRVSNVRLSTLEEDAPSGKVLWVWDVDRGVDAPPGAVVTPLTP